MAQRRFPHIPCPALPKSCARLPGLALTLDLLVFYFSFSGRISIQAYWLYWNLPLFLVLAAGQALYWLGYGLQPSIGLSLFLLWPVLAVSAKRLHDINLSAKWLLLHCLPVIGNALLIFVLSCIPRPKRRKNKVRCY